MDCKHSKQDCTTVSLAVLVCVYVMCCFFTRENSSYFVFSARFSHSVQHMKVLVMPHGGYWFGHSNFEGVNNFKKHFEQEKPNVGGDSGKNRVCVCME